LPFTCELAARATPSAETAATPPKTGGELQGPARGSGKNLKSRKLFVREHSEYGKRPSLIMLGPSDGIKQYFVQRF
jgi:hypothetical protein